MKTFTILTAVVFSVISLTVFAQFSDTLPAEKDALLRQYNGIGDNTNRGNYQYTNMAAWTNGGFPVNSRTIIDFDLSVYPFGTTVLKAELFLYADKNSSDFPNGHEQLTESNECIARRVVEDWNEYSVTWNNRPASTTLHEITIPPSETNFQDYVIDVTELVQDMIDDPSVSFGFLIKIKQEVFYTNMVFGSRDNQDKNIHPKLVVNFEPSGMGENNSQLFQFSIYPNPVNSWVNINIEDESNKEFVLKLFDSRGQLIETIKSISSGKTKIDINNLASGLYFFQLIDERQVYQIKKLVVK